MTVPLPDLPTGTVLELAKEDWRCGGFRLLLRVETTRPDLSGYYDNEWLWISGLQLAQDGTPMGHLDALVRVAALPDRRSHPTAPAHRSPAGPSADRP